MIFGNPYKFAILAEHISEWNSDENSFKNGLFHCFIDGAMLPDELRTATLNVEANFFDERNALITLPENCELFEAPKKQAFNTMLGMWSPDLVDPDADIPDDFDQSYLYLAATHHLRDAGFYFFCVTCGDEVRILGAKVCSNKEGPLGKWYWENENPFLIYEAFLSKDEIREMMSKVLEYCYSLNDE